MDAHRLTLQRARVGPGVAPGGQRIPRPVGAVAGADASWEALPASTRRGLGLAEVRAALGIPVGGSEPVLVEEMPGPPGRPAAVVALLFEEDGETEVVLTRRSGHLRAHTGEVAFPGGRLDPDEAPVDAALRESSEEIGVDPTAVEVVGGLRPLTTYTRRSVVHPFVGFLAGRPDVRPNPAEVERVFSVRLADLAATGTFHEERWPVPGTPAGSDRWHAVNFFEIDGDLLWGVTARLIRELLERAYAGRLTGFGRR